MSICFSIGPCVLGRLLVAWTDVGTCALLLGNDDAALQADLRSRLDEAIQIPPGVEFDRAQQQVKQPWRAWTNPLDLRGTDFQKSVWAALQAIPPGTTSTYAQVAATVGRPRAHRAVAAACAANPLAIVVPCHRVVASTGKLSGYRWGTERKRQLLGREAARLEARAEDPPDWLG